MHLCYRPIKCVHASGLICRRLYPTRKPTLQKNIWDYALFCQLDAVLDWFRVTGRNAMTSKTHRDDTISLHTYWSSHVLMMRAIRITVHADVWKKRTRRQDKNCHMRSKHIAGTWIHWSVYWNVLPHNNVNQKHNSCNCVDSLWRWLQMPNVTWN